MIEVSCLTDTQYFFLNIIFPMPAVSVLSNDNHGVM